MFRCKGGETAFTGACKYEVGKVNAAEKKPTASLNKNKASLIGRIFNTRGLML
jgi:hypothetical protein